MRAIHHRLVRGLPVRHHSQLLRPLRRLHGPQKHLSPRDEGGARHFCVCHCCTEVDGDRRRRAARRALCPGSCCGRRCRRLALRRSRLALRRPVALLSAAPARRLPQACLFRCRPLRRPRRGVSRRQCWAVVQPAPCVCDVCVCVCVCVHDMHVCVSVWVVCQCLCNLHF
jgi:hypothetical protein